MHRPRAPAFLCRVSLTRQQHPDPHDQQDHGEYPFQRLDRELMGEARAERREVHADGHDNQRGGPVEVAEGMGGQGRVVEARDDHGARAGHGHGQTAGRRDRDGVADIDPVP